MPAEPRRRQKVFTEEELKDIEQKRIRGEISCAECRRLKLRCDKKVPCGSCCRRGCESICPCGILAAGQGTRFILADTDHLHRKISAMSQRIRQLEDALAILQATLSAERHPLLADELLKVKFGAEAANQVSSEDRQSAAETQAIDALGTLTLTDSGDMRYFGRSGGTETLIAGEEWEDISDPDEEVPKSDTYPTAFPFARRPIPISELSKHLPSKERAFHLGQLYLDHAALFFRPIKSDELFNIFLPQVYADRSSLTSESLAMLYMVLALGALFDLTLKPYNKEADAYYKLGVSALSIRPVLDTPQLDTVRAVGLMANYHSMASKKYSRDSAWCCMSLAAKLATGLGLHRDSARWHMDAATVQKRRTLWWEVFTSDISHSLALGRPPSIHQSFADCEFPTDEEATLSHTGEVEYGFWRMKYTFARDIFSAVVDATLTVKSPSYSTLLDLDKKVRQMSFPSSVKPYAKLEDSEEDFYSSSKALRDFYASQHRTVTMLYLHRSFFAQSILDHPSNPLLSPFAPSFLTAFRSASILIKAAAHQFDRCSALAVRVWFHLYHVFTSAVVVGSVVTRSPNSNIAAGALLDLELAITMFERSQQHSARAKIALGVLRKLKDKAVKTYTQSRGQSLPKQVELPNSGSSEHQSVNGSAVSVKQEYDSEDELAIFGGQTKVLTKTHRPKSRPYNENSPGSVGSDYSTSPPPPPQTAELGSPVHVHPSLVDYLKDGGGRTSEADPTDPYTTAREWQRAPDYMDVTPSAFASSSGWDGGLFNVEAPGSPWQTSPISPTGLYQSLPHPQYPANPYPQMSSDWGPFPNTVTRAAAMQFGPGFGDAGVGRRQGSMAQHGDMAELGLTAESNMDVGWVSFIREVGLFGGTQDTQPSSKSPQDRLPPMPPPH